MPTIFDAAGKLPNHRRCKRCKRKLVNPKWRRAGYGPVCLEKHRYERIMREGKE